ncbi:MAG: DUF2865 domain-containing protein [Hyphomicrobiaceae bacterium]|nr:DUF2865 domain-containing protein [Hyphomicrobiaceae bacterium]
MVVLLGAAAAFSSAAVGIRLISLIDERILDGSGHAAIDRGRYGTGTLTAEPSVAIAQSGSVVPSSSSSRTPAESLPPAAGSFEDNAAASFHNGREGTFKTYCVRLCDGYFWPVSFSAARGQLDRDKSVCEASCGSPARLFVHQIPGGSPATMTTLDGLPYAALKTAFQFRTRFDAQCKCRAHPWEQQATDQHRLYAAVEAARKGNAEAADQAKALAARLAARRRAEDEQNQIASRKADRELSDLARTVETKPIAVAAVATPPRLPRAADATMMRLGAVSDDRPSKTGWRAHSGHNRRWQDRAFSGQ